MTPQHFVKPLALAATLAAPLLLHCSSETPIALDDPPAGGLASAVTYGLQVSTSANRSSPKSLVSANLSGQVYIFTSPDTSVDAVTFYLDGQYIRIDKDPRFDFSGTGGSGNAKPWDASLVPAGSHTIRADVKLFNGTTRTVSASFTTIGPQGGPPPPPPPPSGTVLVAPGQNIQALVDAKPAGTTFRLRTGIHRRQFVIPKSGMIFEGAPGAILDGEMAVPHAFRGDFNGRNADRVTIRGLEIRNYASPLRTGAIRAGGSVTKTSGWIVERCDVHHNDGGGIRIGNGMTVRDSRIHHNGQIGIVGSGDNVVIQNNEIAFNNTRDVVNTVGLAEFGGTKFAGTRNLVLRDNYVHDNTGNGLWLDGGTVGTLVEGNRVIDNTFQGIMIEISYRVTVRNNQVAGNGFGRRLGWLYGAGIQVSSSPDVEVYGNTVTNNARGIIAIQQNRGTGALGPLHIKNLNVHDNVVTMQIGWTGIGDDTGDTSVFTSRNNRFVRNTYHLGPEVQYFVWMHAKRTETAWRSFGNDVNGVFHR